MNSPILTYEQWFKEEEERNLEVYTQDTIEILNEQEVESVKTFEQFCKDGYIAYLQDMINEVSIHNIPILDQEVGEL